MSALLWMLAVVLALVTLVLWDEAGPKDPLERTVVTSKGPVGFELPRRARIGAELRIVLLPPLPEGVSAKVKYRRTDEGDLWSVTPMRPGVLGPARGGGLDATVAWSAGLPGLDLRGAGYEYYVLLDDGSGVERSVTGDEPIRARYEDAVPAPAFAARILVALASIVLAARTSLEAMRHDGRLTALMWLATVSLLCGVFVTDPLVGWHELGVWRSGVPFGLGWAQNRVLLAAAAWTAAIVLNRGGRRNLWAVHGAAAATFIVRTSS